MKSGYSWTELVDMAIQVEKVGERFYRDAAEGSDEDERGSFKDLADAEREHAEIFHSLLPDNFVEGTRGIDSDEAKPYVEAIVGGDLLGYLRGCDVSSFGSVGEILEFALGFEEESVKFYASLREHVTSASGPVIERIIAEEKKHIEKIQAMLADLPA